MVAKHRMDQLISLVKDLGMLELEMRQYEQEVASGNSPNRPKHGEVANMAFGMLAVMNKSKTLFDEQASIIREISQPVADQMDVILAAYDDTQSKIEIELEKMADTKAGQPAQPELIESIDMYVYDLGRHYDELRKMAGLAYNCLAGAINFIESGTKRSGRKQGRPMTSR